MRIAEQFNIVIEGRGLEGQAKERFEAIIQGMVNGIGATAAGKIMLYWIKNNATHRDWVLITPYSTRDEAKKDPCNAQAWDDLWPVQIGRREILCAPVNFSPETFMKTGCHIGPNMTPLEVLFHELVHAQRIVNRISGDVELKGSLAAFENEEEYFAVIFTDVWSSAHAWTSVAANGLRSDHSTGRLWDQSPENFLSNRDNYRLVKKYCGQQPKMTADLAAVKCAFNPFTTYYAWRAKGYEPR